MRFIKLYEKITEWEWYDDVATSRVFIHLLLTANWKDASWHGIKIKRGQRIISFRGLAEETSLSEQQVRTAISHLKATHELTQYSTHHYTIVTVENYESYQGCDKTTNTPSNAQPNTASTSDIEEYRTIENNIIPTVLSKVPYQDVVDAYHEECPSLPKVIKLTDTRRKHIKARLSNHSLDELREIFRRVEHSNFCKGDNPNGWVADFDFITRSEDSITKILEGKYDDREKNNGRTNRNNQKFGNEASRITDEKRRRTEEWEARERLLFSGRES